MVKMDRADLYGLFVLGESFQCPAKKLARPLFRLGGVMSSAPALH